MLRKYLLVGLSYLVCQVGVLEAREFAPYFGLKVENHSNIKRLSQDPVEDTLISPYMGVDYEDVTGEYEARINGQITHETFADNSFSDDTLLKLDGYVDWIVQPGRFTWAVEDYADQYRVDIQQRDNPGNRQTVNVFALGPDFLLSQNLGDLLIKARYADVTYSETAEDSGRFIGALSLKRTLNPYSSMNFDSTLSIVDYKDQFWDDYNVITTGLRYNRELPYGFLSGSAGYNGFDFSSGESKNDPYFDVNLSLNLTGGSRLDFSGAFKLTDLALESFNPLYTRLLDDLEINTLLEQTTERGASGVYRVKRAFASYSYQGELFSSSLYGFVNQSRYFDFVDNNSDENGIGFSLGYELTSEVQVRGGVSASDITYLSELDGFDVKWRAYEVAGSYNFAENLFLIAGVSKEDSQSVEPLRDFKDTRVYLVVEYRVPRTVKE